MMIKANWTKLCILSILVLAGITNAADLINYGSFEDPAIEAGWTQYNYGATAPTGWVKTFGGLNPCALYYPVEEWAFYGQLDGNQAVLLDINNKIDAVDSGIVMQEGVDVTLYFDAAWFGGQGYDTGDFIDRFRLYYPNYSGAVAEGYNFISFSPYSNNVGMTTFSYTYTPVAADEGEVWNPAFLPLSSTDVIILDNIRYEVAGGELLDGDANRDGVVSAGDYASVQANFGSTGDPGILGDANGDGVVSAGDYASVQANFGNTAPTASTVPEPLTISLFTISSLVLLKRRK